MIGTRPRVFVPVLAIAVTLAIAALAATGVGLAASTATNANAVSDGPPAVTHLASPHEYAEFRTEAEYLNRTTVYPGQPVRVVETVENYGTEAGSYTGLLLVGLELRQTDDVWVEPETRANATFTTSFDEPGTYNVYVRTNWIGRVTVRERPEPTANATRTGNGTATVAVGNATAGTHLSTPLPAMNTTDRLDAESLGIGFDAPARRLNVSVAETPAPANASLESLPPGLDPVGFVTVSHDGRSAAIANVSLSLAVDGRTDAEGQRDGEGALSVVRYDAGTGDWRRLDTGPSTTTAAFGLNGTGSFGENVTDVGLPDAAGLLRDGPGAGDLLGAKAGDGTRNDTATTAGNRTANDTASIARYDLSVPSSGTVAVARQRPAITVRSTNVAPATLTTDRRAVVTATVRNDGRADGRATVPLVVDGERIGARNVSLGPGAETAIRFTLTFERAGIHRLAVGDGSAQSVIVDPAPTPMPTVDSTPVEAARDAATPAAVADESRTGRSGFTSLALIGTVLAGIVGVARWRE